MGFAGGLSMRRDGLYHPLGRVPVLLFILVAVLLQFPGARDLVGVPYSGIVTRNLVVQSVESTSPNLDKPVQQGDEIRAVGGVPVRNYNHFRYLVSLNREGSPQEYVFATESGSVAIEIEYTTVPPSVVYRGFGKILVGFTFLLTGLLVLLRRADSIGILFALNCTALFFLLSERPVFPVPISQIGGELLEDIVLIAFPALFLHFFLVFPERAHALRAGTAFQRAALVYSIPLLLIAVVFVLAILRFQLTPVPATALRWVIYASTVYTVGYLVASLVVFIRSYRRSGVAQKVKLRIAIAGTVAGIVPFLAVITWRQVMPGEYSIWEFLSALALAFVSISFAYAILKHGAIELNIVVRKSIVYALLTGAIIAAYYGLVRFLGDFFTTQFHLRPVYFSIIAVLVLAVVFHPARQFVQGLVDRLFFRGEYDYKREVVEFNRQLSRRLTKKEILDYFSERMRALLKASYVAFYKKGDAGEQFRLDVVDVDAKTLPDTFPRGSLLGRYLGRFRKPLMAEYLDESWAERHLDMQSTAFLASSQAAVCLPIGSTESLFGLIVLGVKRSGLPYSRADSELLETFSEHLALVLENADLHEATIEKERLKNEVLLAREIQLSLLPKAPPKRENLELHGKMESSVEVGGDYYDFFELGRHSVGVVIGDVSGKGVPAAMLVSSLRAVFRNLAMREGTGVAQVVGDLNRYLCENSKGAQYATIFYAIFELDASTLTFCNAGHCPALLVKSQYVDRLGEGGMMLGIDAAHRYEEGRVRIERGDVLCFYTDGVTEQADPAGREYGESRLIEFLRANRNLPLTALQERLFATVLAFGNGRQDDDITAIIARYKTSY
jgi:sigma-B regulation protein RsbU (phosphoserine phosphatase)